MPRNITVYISDDLDERMKSHQEVNWSEVCREGIENYLSSRVETEDVKKRLTDLETDVKLIKGIQTVEVDIEPLKQAIKEVKNKLENIELALSGGK